MNLQALVHVYQSQLIDGNDCNVVQMDAKDEGSWGGQK